MQGMYVILYRSIFTVNCCLIAFQEVLNSQEAWDSAMNQGKLYGEFFFLVLIN